MGETILRLKDHSMRNYDIAIETKSGNTDRAMFIAEDPAPILCRDISILLDITSILLDITIVDAQRGAPLAGERHAIDRRAGFCKRRRQRYNRLKCNTNLPRPH